MTKITIHQQLNLKKTEFSDLVDFLGYLASCIDESKTEMGVLPDEEVTPEILKKMKEAQRLSETNPERFVDIR